jgi:hypothetical protein
MEKASTREVEVKKKPIKDEHMKYVKLAGRIWQYLNGRYEDNDKEMEAVAKIIYRYLEFK